MMKNTFAVTAIFSIALALAVGAQQPPAGRGRGAAPPPPPPAPAAGSPAIVKTNAELMEVLKKNIAAAGDAQSSSPITANDQYRASIVHRVKPAGAITHAGNTEMHYILSGSGTVVTGGTVVRPPAGSTALASIENGQTRHVVKGDIIIVPENSPHWYKDVEGEITYLEVRWVAPKK